MIDTLEIIEQGTGKMIIELCKECNIPVINTDGTYRPLLDIFKDLSLFLYKDE